jgi:hypothetical protein
MSSEAVAAFVFLRDVPRPQVLVGIRRPEHNERHPGVVSVPTLRIPQEVMYSLLRDVPDALTTPSDLSGPQVCFGAPRATTTLEGLLTEAVLAKKLRMGDLLEAGLLSGSCFVRCLLGGDVEDPTGRDGRVEPTLMVTIVAKLRHGADQLPTSSASYSALSWVAPEEFVMAWRTRDGQRLFPRANPLEVCIRGLCVQSAVRVLSGADARAV